MLKIIFSCQIAFLFVFGSYSVTRAQNYGYWISDTDFHNFTVDSNTIVLYFYDEFVSLNDSATFLSGIQSGIITEIDVTNGSDDVTFCRIETSFKIVNPIDFLAYFGITTSHLKAYSYVFLSEQQLKISPTNELLFRLKPERSMRDLDGIINSYQAEFVENIHGVYVYSLPKIDDVFLMANALHQTGNVSWVEPDMYFNYGLTDPLYPEQFYLHNIGQTIKGETGTLDIDIDADKVWAIATGVGIKVAVLDDGVEAHEDLQRADGSSKVLSGFTPNCIIDCDGRPLPDGYHGQPCAGIIAATHNNIGIKGIAPDCEIIPIRVFKKGGVGKSNKSFAKAIGVAWSDLGADIMSCSFGDHMFSNIMKDAFDIARSQGRNGKGCVVIASTGNYLCPLDFIDVAYPAKNPGVIAVGAVGIDGVIATYSCRGPEVDVVAPSSSVCGNLNIKTTDRMGNKGFNITNYTNFGGTSAAAPQVAAIAALMLSVNPNLTEEEVVCRIQTTATDLGTPGFDENFGYGLANAYYAVAYDFMTVSDELITGVQKYTAENVVELGDNCIIENTGNNLANVQVKAGEKIVLKPGFHAKSGSFVHLTIDQFGPCGFGPRVMNSEVIQDEQAVSSEALIPVHFDATIEIFPNPTTGIFEVINEKVEDSVLDISMYDLSGRIVHQQTGISSRIQIDANHLSTGTYLVRTGNGSNFNTIRVVISRYRIHLKLGFQVHNGVREEPPLI